MIKMKKTELQLYFMDQEIAELLEDAVKLHAFIPYSEGSDLQVIHWNIDGGNDMERIREQFPDVDIRLLFIYEGGKTAAIDWWTGHTVRDSTGVAYIEDQDGVYTFGQVEDGRWFVLFDREDESDPLAQGDQIDSFDTPSFLNDSWVKLGLYENMLELYEEMKENLPEGYKVVSRWPEQSAKSPTSS